MQHMSISESNYEKLPGHSGRGIFFWKSKTRLYLGPDHLLIELSDWVSEHYQRIYYRDVQAVLVEATYRQRNWTIILVSLAILFGVFLLVSLGTSMVLTGFWIFWVGLFVSAALVNHWRGAGCQCHVVTPVQKAELSSLNRLPMALSVVELIKAKVREAQGVLSQEEVSANDLDTQQVLAHHPGYVPDTSAPPQYVYRGTWHWLSFGLSIVSAGMVGLSLIERSILQSIVGGIFFYVSGVCIVMALINQRKAMLPDGLRWMTWALFFYIALSLFASQMIGVILVATEDPTLLENSWEMFEYIATLPLEDYPVLYGLTVVSLVINLIFGVLGMLLLSLTRFPEYSDTALSSSSRSEPSTDLEPSSAPPPTDQSSSEDSSDPRTGV